MVTSQMTMSASRINANMSARMLPASTTSAVLPPASPHCCNAGVISSSCTRSKSTDWPDESFLVPKPRMTKARSMSSALHLGFAHGKAGEVCRHDLSLSDLPADPAEIGNAVDRIKFLHGLRLDIPAPQRVETIARELRVV